MPDFWELQLRDRVVVAAEGRLQGTVGTITGIEGDQCRLHIKVSLVIVYCLMISYCFSNYAAIHFFRICADYLYTGS